MPITGQEVHNAFLNKRAKATEGYELEVKLSHRFEVRDYEIKVSGRVDGVVRHGQESLCLEEIKSDLDIHRLAAVLKASKEHPYRLQLKTYGFFYKQEFGFDCDLQLVLVSSKDGSSLTVNVPFDQNEYQIWLDKRLEEIIEQYERQKALSLQRQELASSLGFPFPKMRIGQGQLVSSTASILKNDKSCLIQAPTGLGKTVGVLYPALKSSLSRGAQVVYVTAKNSQHEAVVDAVKKLNDCTKSKQLKTLVLTAKAKVCLKDEVYCNSDYCEYARDYYEKVEANKLRDLASSSDLMDKDKFVDLGKKYKVCPFELSLDCVERADIVVGDYNYVFSPRNVMGRFVSSPFKELRYHPILLVDEAHNLPDRAKSYYQSELSEAALIDIRSRIEKQLPNYSLTGQALIEDLLKIMRAFSNGGRYNVKQIHVRSALFESVKERISEFVLGYLQSSLVLLNRDPLLELNNLVSEFCASLDNEGEEFVVLANPENGGTLKVVCLDASSRLKETYKKTRAVIAFSATLKPFDYFANVLGFDFDKLEFQEFDSPFPEENRKLMIVPQVSTKYADRQRNYGKISEAIKKITKMQTGNYVVFFPSFSFLEEVLALTRFKEASILVQERAMTQDKVRKILDSLRDEKRRNNVLFAVQGGTFAEGVDYPGDMLIGAIIVGPGLPKYDLETELLQKYFEGKYKQGYKYTFVYPAMAKVIQSAGRVIRGERDRGLLVLMDRRFITPAYLEAMPEYWLCKGSKSLVSSKILSDIDQFWSGSGKELISSKRA